MKQVDTIILVKDIKRSAGFYKNIFGLEVLHDWETMIIFKNRLSLHQTDKLLPEEFAESLKEHHNKGFIIYLELENGKKLEEVLLNLQKNNVEIIHGIYNLPWQRIIRVYDPDHNIIEIGEPAGTE